MTQDPAPEGWRLDSLNCLIPVKLCMVLSQVNEKYLVSEVQPVDWNLEEHVHS